MVQQSRQGCLATCRIAVLRCLERLPIVDVVAVAVVESVYEQTFGRENPENRGLRLGYLFVAKI